MVSDRVLELIQLYKQNLSQEFFIFTIYQNYKLALIGITWVHVMIFGLSL